MRTVPAFIRFAVCLCSVGLAAAGEVQGQENTPPAWLVFGGASAGADYASIYAGAISGPAGGLWDPGVRLRSFSSAGFYRTGAKAARHTIPFASSAMLAGYQFAAGEHSLTVLAGPEATYFARSDPPHYTGGWHLGAKALAEGHFAIGKNSSAEAHIGYATALRRLEAGSRILTRLAGPWRGGPEAALFDKLDGRDVRLGLALSRREERSGLSASAGVSFSDEKDANLYVTIGFDQSF